MFFNYKLTSLEGAALCVAGTSSKGKTLVVKVDNAGTVGVYAKGHCATRPYSTNLVNAISIVSQGMTVYLRVRKIRRCSDKGSILVDTINKCNIKMLCEE